ncbi:type VII secretion-associated serine protease mycosin [Haloactinomyces albus]|uniref:Membrane-anchored mycosin MYCP n=1 Tax=Haloactinomyces albus TaxID=1352928 RepID=A0AAE3ZER6_9ACTN|nr:type VII secretion-associated serine protease mycosin [Haloactinomyces albus]MDR7302506.1 membrane-anchored mycosin MYCP [Haloactinomyces albus]
MRSTTSLRRALALSATAGMLALSGPALPAAAQQAEGDREFQPPPRNPAMQAPSAPLSPVGSKYKQQQACMQASNGGPTIEREPWSQRLLGFERAHRQGWTGQGQTIAVIDTGVNQHQRLPGLTDGSSRVPGGALVDCDGHGTIVAGIIAATPTAETGFLGIAPKSTILSVRQSSSVWQHQQSGEPIGNTRTMAQAIKYATDRGAGVINISQASCQSMVRASNPADQGNQKLYNAVRYAYEQGTVVVAAAGNTGGQCKQNPPGNPTTAVLPAWFDKYVLTVASVNERGAPSDFTVPGPWVDVAAPGEDLISLDPGRGATGLANQVTHGSNDQAQPIQGTSFAAPYVSGLAALIQQKFEDLSVGEIMERIEKTAQHPGGTDGRNDIIGYGMINPMAALNDVIPAENGPAAAPIEPRRLEAHVFPRENWAAIAVAFGGAVGGLGTVVFTAFLMNAIRKVRSRRAQAPASRLRL